MRLFIEHRPAEAKAESSAGELSDLQLRSHTTGQILRDLPRSHDAPDTACGRLPRSRYTTRQSTSIFRPDRYKSPTVCRPEAAAVPAEIEYTIIDFFRHFFAGEKSRIVTFFVQKCNFIEIFRLTQVNIAVYHISIYRYDQIAAGVRSTDVCGAPESGILYGDREDNGKAPKEFLLRCVSI